MLVIFIIQAVGNGYAAKGFVYELVSSPLLLPENAPNFGDEVQFSPSIQLNGIKNLNLDATGESNRYIVAADTANTESAAGIRGNILRASTVRCDSLPSEVDNSNTSVSGTIHNTGGNHVQIMDNTQDSNPKISCSVGDITLKQRNMDALMSAISLCNNAELRGDGSLIGQPTEVGLQLVTMEE